MVSDTFVHAQYSRGGCRLKLILSCLCLSLQSWLLVKPQVKQRKLMIIRVGQQFVLNQMPTFDENTAFSFCIILLGIFLMSIEHLIAIVKSSKLAWAGQIEKSVVNLLNDYSTYGSGQWSESDRDKIWVPPHSSLHWTQASARPLIFSNRSAMHPPAPGLTAHSPSGWTCRSAPLSLVVRAPPSLVNRPHVSPG